MLNKTEIANFQNEVLSWYKENGRVLPWRQTTDPYKILVSEIMLQQTQVERVIPKYEAWLQTLPTVDALAIVSGETLLKLWSGLGYNRRAVNLRRAAQAIVSIGDFPADLKSLQLLPGIGTYTSAAICSFAFNQDVALIDTNVKRIYQLLVFGDVKDPSLKELQLVADTFLPTGRSRDWHNALMDIGTILSKAKGARSQQMRLREMFSSLAGANLPEVSELPLKRPKQSSFKASKRYWRGLIIKSLTSSGSLSFNELKIKLADISSSEYDLDQLVNQLANEGLLIKDENIINLPK